MPVTAAAIDALLPQTQCRKCGYDGCTPYAEAIASGTAQINRCPPGGEDGIRELAALLGIAPVPLDPECGQEGPRTVAVIEEAHCIGCTLCIQACPVDAIAGAAKLMHTVIAALCTGCELCIPPCPVDCIRISERVPQPDRATLRVEAQQARRRYEARLGRLERQRTAEKNKRKPRERDLKQETIARAMERARVRLAARTR
ncbi:MAG TPA: RnfABCDGE type electron transport complex subunit B [Burkholderiales bacterium]|nr:RnfABCDGE type electron transport complex subunit B [Burkholderiales bacterium]